MGEQPSADTAGNISAALERLAQVQRVLMQQTATKHRLSPIQTRILLGLHTGPRRCHPSELAEDLGVTRATVTDAVAALRSKQLVTHLADATDRRRTTLQLSEAGRRTARELSTWSAPMTRRVASLPARNQGHLLAGLLDLIAGLQADGLVPHQGMCLPADSSAPPPRPRPAVGTTAPCSRRPWRHRSCESTVPSTSRSRELG